MKGWNGNLAAGNAFITDGAMMMVMHHCVDNETLGRMLATPAPAIRRRASDHRCRKLWRDHIRRPQSALELTGESYQQGAIRFRLLKVKTTGREVWVDDVRLTLLARVCPYDRMTQFVGARRSIEVNRQHPVILWRGRWPVAVLMPLSTTFHGDPRQGAKP